MFIGNSLILLKSSNYYSINIHTSHIAIPFHLVIVMFFILSLFETPSHLSLVFTLGSSYRLTLSNHFHHNSQRGDQHVSNIPYIFVNEKNRLSDMIEISLIFE